MPYFVLSILVFFLSTAPAISFAGDCNKTVMGGGCTAQVDAGVSPHMHAQVLPVVDTKSKASLATVKPVSVNKNEKVSNSLPTQKPQI